MSLKKLNRLLFLYILVRFGSMEILFYWIQHVPRSNDSQIISLRLVGARISIQSPNFGNGSVLFLEEHYCCRHVLCLCMFTEKASIIPSNSIYVFQAHNLKFKHFCRKKICIDLFDRTQNKLYKIKFFLIKWIKFAHNIKARKIISFSQKNFCTYTN